MGRVWLGKLGVSVALAISVAAFGLVIAACGGSGDSSSSTSSTEASTAEEQQADGSGSNGEGVDVGVGKPIPLTLEDLKIAFVAGGLNSSLGVKEKEGVEKVADKYGVPVTTFDGEENLTRQLGLYQNIVDGGEFTAIVTLPIGAQQACQVLSKSAPAKGIVVSIITTPLCNRESEPVKGDGLWSPGTLNTVGDAVNPESLEAWAKVCAEETDGGEAILLNGFAGWSGFKAMTAAYEKAGVEIVENYSTNYSPEDGLAKTSAALLAHPNLKLIASMYPPLTEGAIQALKSAGKKPGVDVELCSYSGGRESMLNAVESGEIAVDAYLNSEWVAMAATQSIINAIEGKSVPRVIVPGEEGKIVTGGTVVWPPIYTKASAAQFVPTGE